MKLTYRGISTVLTNLTPHRIDNDINPLAVLINFKSFISLSNEFNRTKLSNPLLLCDKKILYELTISTPSL